MSERRTTRRGDAARRKRSAGTAGPRDLHTAPTEDELIAARFVTRPNRFIVSARLPDGAIVEAHLADPGRLIELLLPGAELRLRPAPRATRRRTAHSVALIRASSAPHVWVSVETTRANSLAEGLLVTGAVPGLEEDWKLRREVGHGKSRFDFLLERDATRLWVEVKSVTLVDSGLGLFPDAPTTRGKRHVNELTALVRDGDSAMVLFVVQRGDATAVAPHAYIDPAFADALTDAEKTGVVLRAVGFRFDERGRVTGCSSLPVLTPQV